MQLVAAVYTATSSFPREEMFGLTNQLRRASISVASNIAEGQGRLTTGDFMHFLGMARGSALEVQTQLELAKMLRFGKILELDGAEALSEEVVRILNTSITTCRTRIAAKGKRKE